MSSKPFSLDTSFAISDPSIVKPDDLPEFQRTGDILNDRKRAQYRVELQRAVAQGLVDPEEARAAYDSDDNGFFGRTIEAITGIEATDSGLQTFGDALSLGLYASASFAQARADAIKEAGEGYEGGVAPFWHPVRYLPVFSTDEYRKNYRDRTTYSKIFGEDYPVAAFVTDLALDPVMYLTFGTGTGAQVGVKTANKAAAKAIGEEVATGTTKTLSRWGTKVHKEAVEELWPKIQDEIAEGAAKGEKLGAQKARLELNDRAAAYMLENYPRLARKAWEKESGTFLQGRLTSRARDFIGRQSNQARSAVGLKGTSEGAIPNMAHVFNETTPLAFKEIGVGGARIRRTLEAIPKETFYGGALHSTMKAFSRTWGLDENTRAVLGKMEDTKKFETREFVQRISKEFDGITDDEAVSVTKYLENSFSKNARNSADAVDVEYSSRVIDFAAKARAIFDEIAEEEQKVGILNQTLDDYVSHIFHFDQAKKEVVLGRAKELGMGGRTNKFSLHRHIASIDDLKRVLPDEAIEENIYKILHRRKLASIDLVNKQKFYQEMIAAHGYPKTLIAKAGQGVAGAWRKAMNELRDTQASISDLSQIWEHGGVQVAKWGFVQGDNSRNLDALEFLTTNREARDTSASWVTDYLRNFTGRVKRTFKTTVASESVELDALTAVRGLLNNDPFDQVPAGNLYTVLGKFDKELRSKGVAPLLALMPDLKVALRQTLKDPNKPTKAYTEFIDKLSKPVAGLKKDAIIPEDLALAAANYRRQLGILTDVTKPVPQTMEQITKMLGPQRFGFMPDETKQLLDIMFDKKTLDDLSATEADRLHDFLSLNGGRKLPQTYKPLTGERMGTVTIPVPPGQRPSLVKTNIDEVTESIGKESSKLKTNVDELNTRLGNLRKKVNEQIAGGKQISNLTQKIKAATGEERTRLIAERRALVEKFGNPSDIDRVVRNTRKSMAPIRQSIKLRKKQAAYQDALLKYEKAYDANLKAPTAATDKALRKAKARAEKLADETGVELSLKTTKAPAPARQATRADPRLGADGRFDQFGPDIQRVGERPFTIDAAEYYMPESVVGIINEINKSLYAHEMGTLFKAYDFVQNIFKAPLMAVFPEFYMRNTVTNVALTALKSGIALLHPEYQKTFVQAMTYTLSKEVFDISNLPKSQATFMAVAGGSGGAIVGGMGADEGFLNTLQGAATGAAFGVTGGALAGGVTGFFAREGLKEIASGGILTYGAAGGLAGALANDDDRLAGFIGGAAMAAGGARYALGDGYRNVAKLAQAKTKIGDQVFTIEELVNEFAKRGGMTTRVSDEIFRQSGSKAIAMGERTGKTADAIAVKNVSYENALMARDSFRAGELASEIPTRLMMFIVESKRTGSLAQGAKAVKDYLFDYSNLSMVERRVIKRAMPFYTWTKHAMRTSADSVIQSPGRVSAQMRFVQAGNDDYDPGDMPDWLSERLKRVKVVFNPETGKREVEVKAGYGLVQEDTLQLWKDTFGGNITGFFGRGPLGLTPAIEAALNRDFFRDSVIVEKDLYDKSAFRSGRQFKDAPDWMRKAVGYYVDADGYPKVDPRAAWMLSEVPVSRFFGIAKKVYENEGQDLNYISLARQVLGEKIYKYGPEQKLYYDKAKLDRMGAFLKNIGQIKTVQLTTPSR
jgi:hypothetical protein